MSILENYVEDILTPTADQLQFLKSGIKSIQSVLKNNAKITPRDIHKGGSYQNRTMLKYKLDVDLIYVYNKSEEIGNDWKKLITSIYKVLKANFPKIEIEEAGNLAVHLHTSYKESPIKFDIVPCYFVNSPKVMEQHTNSKLYQGITTIWHTRYLIRYKNYPFFTEIVSLLKDWKNEHEIPLKSIHL